MTDYESKFTGWRDPKCTEPGCDPGLSNNLQDLLQLFGSNLRPRESRVYHEWFVNYSVDVKAIEGNVMVSRAWRPNVSIVENAGKAKTQFSIPVPMHAISAEFWLYPPLMKMFVE